MDLNSINRVPVRRIADDVQFSTAIKMVKIDVEGFETQVVSGLRSWIDMPNSQIVWVIEADTSKSEGRELVQGFLDRGYFTYVFPSLDCVGFTSNRAKILQPFRIRQLEDVRRHQVNPFNNYIFMSPTTVERLRNETKIQL